MLREFCQVTDSRSIFVYQSMQEKLPPTGTATGSSLRTHGDKNKPEDITSPGLFLITIQVHNFYSIFSDSAFSYSAFSLRSSSSFLTVG